MYSNLQNGPGYTEAQIEFIAGLLREAYTASQIAVRFHEEFRRDVSRSAICGIVNRNKTLKAIGFRASAQGGYRKAGVQRKKVPPGNGAASRAVTRLTSPLAGEDTKARRACEPPAGVGEGCDEALPHPSPSAASDSPQAAHRALLSSPTRGEEGAARVSPAEYDRQSRRVVLTDLDAGDCRFPVNDPERPGLEPHLFCGMPRDADAPAECRYCRHHRLRCAGAGTPSERSAGSFLARRAA